MSLGKWAAIDIETSGIDPMSDEIIDVGFLQFEGTKLVNTYRSLVQADVELSKFIEKLTGINSKMLRDAPMWDIVKMEVLDLYGHTLLAHNSDFEKSFLKQYFDRIDDGSDREKYLDSIEYLALLFPGNGSFKLERFICDFGIADGEVHRGYEDSVDLLKVLIMATLMVRRDQAHYQSLQSFFEKYHFEDYWYYKFFLLKENELLELAGQIDFDVETQISNFNDVEESDDVPNIEMTKFDLSFSGKNIEAIFSDVDAIRNLLPGYRYRESQKELALRVGQSLKNGVHSLVQAPTGTGKTLGYLIPASLYCLDEKEQILVATGTKTLQHQAMNKDVPLLKKMLSLTDEDLKVRQLVGSSNHLCELLFRQSETDGDLLTHSLKFEERYIELFFETLFWHNARNSKKIIRGDLPFVLKRKFKTFKEKERSLTVDFRACTGHKCPFKETCSYMLGLREAKEADIIVGNHALMFSWPRSFSRPARVIVDEAHKLEGETSSAFSLEVTQELLDSFVTSISHQNGLGSLFYLLARTEKETGSSTPVINKIRDDANGTHQMLLDHLMDLPETIERYFKKGPRYTDQFWNELPMITKNDRNTTLETTIFNRFESCYNILQIFSDSLMPYRERWDIKDIKDDKQIIALTRFQVFLGQLDDLVLSFEYALQAKEEYCSSIRYHEDYGFALSTAPVNVGRILHDNLLETSKAVIMTSATLGNATGDSGVRGIEWASGYLYTKPEKRFKTGFYLPAVYDYKNKAKVYLCDDSLPFYHPHFVEITLEKTRGLIRDLGGRTLLLFSAKARFEVAREVLLAQFDGEIPLFIQGMGNNVVEDFKNSKNGILLGMESFGEGIDIPGESLQFIFIDKIPDIRMDLVIKERREFYERNIGNEFEDYYLASRARSLHQKLGRLLRTESDTGCVIVVDSRIKKWKSRTMGQFNKLMEPYSIERTSLDIACENVKKFLNGIT